jgi:kynurenine formamidase
MLGKATIVDLTHTVSDDSAPPERSRPDVAGDAERQAQGGTSPMRDLGTRFNAGGVLPNDQRSVARVPSRELLVSAVVVNIAPRVAQSPDYHVTVEDLQAWERQNGRIPRRSAVLLNTGWSRRWADRGRYVNRGPQGVPQVPGFAPAAVAFLVGQRQVRGLGMDVFIPDPPMAGAGASASSLTPGVWQLENLVNLDRLPAKGAKLVVAPLRVEAASAPARVIAILP